MTEQELRKLIREELEVIQEEKTADEKRLDDARLAIISLTQAADMLRRAGATNTAAKDMASQLDGMVEKLRGEIVPGLESMARGTFTSRIGSELGKMGRSVSSAFRGPAR